MKPIINQHIFKSHVLRFGTLVSFILIFQTGCATIQQLSCVRHNIEPQKEYSKTLQLCFGKYPVTYQDKDIEVSRNVYCIGSDRSKPPVILLHELPGLSAKTLEYAESLSTDFTVYVPMLFGKLNQDSLLFGTSAFLFNGEWGWPLGGSDLDSNTPIVKWLRHVVSEIEKEHKEKSIGVIGNCLTGSLPLLLLANEHVRAIVLAQPTLPLRFVSYSDDDRRSLGISKSELSKAKKIVNDKNTKIYGVKFQNDCVSPPEKRDTLMAEFGDHYINAEILKSEYMTPEHCPTGDCGGAHSTLIAEWTPEDKDSPSERRRKEVREYLKNPSTFTRGMP